MDLFYGRAIKSQGKGKRAVFENTVSGKIVGEIILEKNPDDGICNICLQKKKLSLDHVPPKCTGNSGRIRYQNVMNHMVAKSPVIRGLCQNGIQFKTICEPCNNSLGEYDKYIEELFTPAIRYRRTGGTRPYILPVAPNGILRGLCGHFLSAKTTHHRSGFDDLFAKVIDGSSPFPDGFCAYVFPYYGAAIKILRDHLFAVPGVNPILFYIMKIFPLAFVFTERQVIQDWPSWNQYLNLPPSETVPVRLFGHTGCQEDWPESPTLANCAIALGKTSGESIVGFPE